MANGSLHFGGVFANWEAIAGLPGLVSVSGALSDACLFLFLVLGGGTLVAVTVSCRPDRVDSFARCLTFRRRYH
jgi:hypothetical protein